MNELKLDNLSNNEFEKFLSEPYELIIINKEETSKDISEWEELYNELFVNQAYLFTLEKKTFLIRSQLKKIIENDKLNETNNFKLFYTKHEKLIKKIIANSLEN
jgi:hypothetical protein